MQKLNALKKRVEKLNADVSQADLLKEAKLIKTYLQTNNYISDTFQGTPYSFSANECKGKTVTEIAELLKRQLNFYK